VKTTVSIAVTERGTSLGFTLSQATKALRESRSIAILYFRPLH